MPTWPRSAPPRQRRPRHLLTAALIATSLAASAQAPAPALPAALGPGTPWPPVLQEVQQMIRTRPDDVPAFTVRHATPERIAQLMAMPEARALPRSWRENAIIFAGLGGPLMRFDSPSDVLARVQAWFPDELHATRQSPDKRLFGRLHLWGPFEHWQPEAIAFMSLWNCMPQGAWIRPDGNPYARRLGENLLDYPQAAQQSSPKEADFGHCLRQRSGLRPAMTMEQHRRNLLAVQQMAAVAEPVLRQRFAATLQRHGCTRAGPDDCVRVLQMWAELAPHDDALARALRTLEPAVAPDAELPPHTARSANWDDQRLEDGQPRYDAAMRRAAFLRAKLAAIAAAPHTWPADALSHTLRQLTRLRQDLATPYVKRWVHYELTYRNEPFNPWALVRTGGPAMAPALLDELDRLEDTPAQPGAAECEPRQQWLESATEPLRAAHLLNQLRRSPARWPGCTAPDYDWLRQQTRTEHRSLLYGLLAVRPYLEPPLRSDIARGLTADGELCTRRGTVGSEVPGWVDALCMPSPGKAASSTSRTDS